MEDAPLSMNAGAFTTSSEKMSSAFARPTIRAKEDLKDVAAGGWFVGGDSFQNRGGEISHGDAVAPPWASSDAPPTRAEKTDGAPPTAAQGPPAAGRQSQPRPPELPLPPRTGGAADEDLEWLKEIRGWLLVVAVQIAAVTYQAGINPPGGLWQDDSSSDDEKPHTAGHPVARDKDPWFYAMFKVMNVIAFLHSLAVIVLLMKRDVYLRQQHVVVTLRALVISAAISMGVAFAYGYRLQTPNDTTFLVLGCMYIYCATLLTMFIFWRRLPAGDRLRSLAWVGARLAALAPFMLIIAVEPSYPAVLVLLITWCVVVYLWI